MDNEEIFMEEEEKGMDPISTATEFLCNYGWYMVGMILVYGAFRDRINAYINSWISRWKERQYEAKYKKNPDLARARLEALAAARERMQEEVSRKAAEALMKKKEREEEVRLEKLSKLDGNVLGSSSRKSGLKEEYNPLMGEGSSRYRPPKRSCCKKGGGCG